ncbi:L,D-transpeptidase family protein (plasmid) [Devosia neptuniae]|uniref:L,D-transpeptidase family protein n=1 Tax=Devosia neptuniae TaxID=191302 RepID=A0ABY6C7D2_9HYPH|nr:L,D-transpeptidase family protein [Devosia neptuniae]UXN68148.1 L,D-transpeptidase family protein [Devosia neptuniae]
MSRQYRCPTKPTTRQSLPAGRQHRGIDNPALSKWAVGSMWIAFSKPTYGIHGTPEPALIDKTDSHGCIRLANCTLRSWRP